MKLERRGTSSAWDQKARTVSTCLINTGRFSLMCRLRNLPLCRHLLIDWKSSLQPQQNVLCPDLVLSVHLKRSWEPPKKTSENAGANENLSCRCPSNSRIAPAVAPRIVVSYCSSREMPFREWNFAFRKSVSELRELLREYPRTLRELREWPSHSKSIFLAIGMAPSLLKRVTVILVPFPLKWVLSNA